MNIKVAYRLHMQCTKIHMLLYFLVHRLQYHHRKAVTYPVFFSECNIQIRFSVMKQTGKGTDAVPETNAHSLTANEMICKRVDLSVITV